MAENVKVAIRMRPLNENQTAKNFLAVKKNLISIQGVNFSFDYVADQTSTQEQIFQVICKPVVKKCIQGYNGTVFAYGQTGAGKTFTMQGQGLYNPYNQQRGMLQRCLEYLSSKPLKLYCSFFEIYQQQITDLLNTQNQNLQIREHGTKGVYVQNLTQQQVQKIQEAYELIQEGIRNRKVGWTSMNNQSSRSHSVFSVRIVKKQEMKQRESKFHLIDLAGSQRQKGSQTTGNRLKQAGIINKSLSALGNVINTLAEGKHKHIPYRNSKLTFLLKDSLGGNSNTYIIANISPSFHCLGETLSTLKFAYRAKGVKNEVALNEAVDDRTFLQAEVLRLQIALRETDSRIVFDLIKQRVAVEQHLSKQIDKKNQEIQALKESVQDLENKGRNLQMIIKFREAALNKKENEGDLTGFQDLLKENQILKEEIQKHPDLARMYAQNLGLKLEIQELRMEMQEYPGSNR